MRSFDAISDEALGLSTIEIGLIASGHFFCFLLVCLFSPQIALFLVFSEFGGLLAQVPVGILAHKFSRRSVSLAFSIVATALCLCMMLPIANTTIGGIPLIYIMSFLFGSLLLFRSIRSVQRTLPTSLHRTKCCHSARH